MRRLHHTSQAGGQGRDGAAVMLMFAMSDICSRKALLSPAPCCRDWLLPDLSEENSLGYKPGWGCHEAGRKLGASVSKLTLAAQNWQQQRNAQTQVIQKAKKGIRRCNCRVQLFMGHGILGDMGPIKQPMGGTN